MKIQKLAIVILAAAGMLRAAAPPTPPTPTGPATPIQGPAWVAVAERPMDPNYPTTAMFCATNVGTAPVNVYMVIYDTVYAPGTGVLDHETQTVAPLETFCAGAPAVPPSIVNMWLFGVTVAGQANAATALAQLQSLVVTVQFHPMYTPRSEGTFLAPVLLGSVQLPGNNAH